MKNNWNLIPIKFVWQYKQSISDQNPKCQRQGNIVLEVNTGIYLYDLRTGIKRQNFLTSTSQKKYPNGKHVKVVQPSYCKLKLQWNTTLHPSERLKLPLPVIGRMCWDVIRTLLGCWWRGKLVHFTIRILFGII